jgi:hypothetical protein
MEIFCQVLVIENLFEDPEPSKSLDPDPDSSLLVLGSKRTGQTGRFYIHVYGSG